MSTIIAATDFSSTASNAVRYACNLAIEIESEIIIVHTYSVPISYGDIPMPVIPLDEAREIAEGQMAAFQSELVVEFPALKIMTKIYYGEIIDSLLELSEELHGHTLAVIGNSNTGEQTSWIDSKMLQAFKNLNFPVLAVPPDIKYSKVQQICLAYDNIKKNTGRQFEHLTEVATNLGAGLNILFVTTDANTEERQTELKQSLQGEFGDIETKYHVLHSENVDEIMTQFIMQANIDWLAIIPREHSFFESIFHKSHTKHMAHLMHLPILVLH